MVTRVAVLGGRAGADERVGEAVYRRFGSPRDVGRGELRRLECALRSGGIDRVIVLARWNAHAVTRRVRRICRNLGIPLVIEP